MILVNTRGFTLIELLVVIAIIGILASIVLVSFPSAQKKANDSRVVSAISQARTVMIYTKANSSTLAAANFSCTVPNEMVNLCAEVVAKDLGSAALTINRSTDNLEACLSAPLNAGGYYCASSEGLAGRTATACAAGTPTTAPCPTIIGN
ncbi:MAG: type II secretion system protein [bacterium]|nr:type II secretion system protein [bacterium]